MKTRNLILCAFFAVLTAACSWIAAPLPFTPVPINLATLAVFVTGGLLGKKYGAISMAVYAALGACGAPVFSGFTSGMGIIAGPTGGYIIGYIAAAFVIGLVTEKASFRGCLLVANIAGTAACYTLGTIWFMLLTGTHFLSALLLCVIPYLPGDALKIISAAILVKRLRSAVSLDYAH